MSEFLRRNGMVSTFTPAEKAMAGRRIYVGSCDGQMSVQGFTAYSSGEMWALTPPPGKPVPPTPIIGDRVEVHPATNSWIFGDQYGEVVKLGRKYVHVKMDRSGKTKRFIPENIYRIIK